MRAVQCKRVKHAVNSGDGRYAAYQKFAWQQPLPDPGDPPVGTLMPDLARGTTNRIRTEPTQSGYNEVCLLPEDQGLMCNQLAPKTLSAEDLEMAGRPTGASAQSTEDRSQGSSYQSQYLLANKGGPKTLKRSRAAINTCAMPGVYADGSRVEIDACSVMALFGLQPQIYANASVGYTEEDFASCRDEEVPTIVRAYYDYRFEGGGASAGTMLSWWAKNRPSFYHGSASVPLVLSDYLVSEGSRCLPDAPGRKQPPESSNEKMGTEDNEVINRVSGSCSIRESCCPGQKGAKLSDEECDELCTTKMNPLERTRATIGPETWTKILHACADHNSNDRAFCRFAGQYSHDAKVWDTTQTKPLFGAPGSPGQRLCISDDAVSRGAIEIRGGTVVFKTFAPRTAISVFHPIAQGMGSVGFGGYNYTDANGPWTRIPADPTTQPIPVLDGNGVVQTKVMPTFEVPTGLSSAYRGTEAAVVASTECHNNNHRGAQPGTGPIAMPGLFPRSFDLEMGWGSVGSCAYLTTDQAPIQVWGDMPYVDLTGRGGGSSPAAHQMTTGLGSIAGYLSSNSKLWIDEGQVGADNTARVCVVEDANRCVGVCDLGATIAKGVIGGLEIVVGAVVNPLSDYGLFAKFLGLSSFVGGGESIMDAAGAQSGSLSTDLVANAFRAQLFDLYGQDQPEPAYLVRTQYTSNDPLDLYRNYPSMVMGCHPDAEDGNCFADSEPPLAHSDAENPVKYVPGGRTQAQLAKENVWSAKGSMHQTMTIGGNLACHSAMSEDGGSFKRDLGEIKIDGVRAYRNGDSTIEFGVVDAEHMAASQAGFLYTMTDADGKAASLFNSLPSECSLCSGIGTPGDTTNPQPGCTLKNPETNADLAAAYSLLHGVGTDPLAAELFDGALETASRVCLYPHTAKIAELGNPDLCSSQTSEPTAVDSLLGWSVSQKEAIAGPCLWSNDVTESCAFDTSLELKEPSAIKCNHFPSNATSSCANPRWNNDKRVIFPVPVAGSALLRRQTSDFDPLAASTAYCANDWGVGSNGLPFENATWWQSPYGDSDYPGAAPRGPVPRWLPESEMYVYCAGDRLSPSDRHQFCGGTDTQPEGRGVYEGLRLSNRQDLDEVCRKTGKDHTTCLLYADDPSPFSPANLQTIVDRFQEQSVEIVIVPMNFTVVSWAALYLAFTETVYYNDVAQAPPDTRVEAGDNPELFGAAVDLSWKDSGTMVEGLCTSTPGTEWFAQLYAWAERHRTSSTAIGQYKFLSLDTPTTLGASRLVDISDRELYPGVVVQTTVFPKLARITVRSAFNDVVAARASEIVGRTIPPRWVHFKAGATTSSCTRFSVETAGIFEWLSFSAAGECVKAAPSDRVPIVFQGGSTVDDSVVKWCRCWSCSSGVASFRGAATTVDVTAARDLDTENVTVGWTEMVPQFGATPCTDNLTTCENASFPGLSVSLARTVGNPVVNDCGSWGAPVDESDQSRVHDAYCDAILRPKSPPPSVVQLAGAPFYNATSGGLSMAPCSDQCDNLVPCAFAGKVWTCDGNSLVFGDADPAVTAKCPWDYHTEAVNQFSPDNRGPCVPFALAFAEVGGVRYTSAADTDAAVNSDIQTWVLARLEAAQATQRCSARGCPKGPASGAECVAPPAAQGADLDLLLQDWYMAPGAVGEPVGMPFATETEPSAAGRMVLLNLDGFVMARLRKTSNSVAAGRFFVDGLQLGVAGLDGGYNFDANVCLSQSVSPFDGSELIGRPCAEGDPAQEFRFVWHPDIALWRVQLPSPWLCLSQLGEAGRPLAVPCEACSVGVVTNAVVQLPVSAAVVPELELSGAALLDTEVAIPVSEGGLALVVDLNTGLCRRHEAELATETVFGTQHVSEPGVPCELLVLAGRSGLEATFGADVCAGQPIGLLLEACGLDGGELGMVDGSSEAFFEACGTTAADGPGHVPAAAGKSYEVTSAGGGRGAVVRCWPAARGSVGVDQVGESSAAVMIVERGGHGFRDGERLQGVPSRLYARTSKVIWQPSVAGASAEPIVFGADTLNTTELFDLEGMGNVYRLVRAAAHGSIAAWTGVIIEITIISTAIIMHVLLCAGVRRKR